MTVKFTFGVGAGTANEPVRIPAGQAETTIEQTNLDALFLGHGIPRPFRRDGKGDYVNVSSVPLVEAAIGQVVATQAQSGKNHGELPWRPEFGSRVHLLRHAPNNAALDPIADTYVAMAIERWEKRVIVNEVRVGRTETSDGGLNTMELHINYSIAGRTQGAAATGPQSMTVVVPT